MFSSIKKTLKIVFLAIAMYIEKLKQTIVYI